MIVHQCKILIIHCIDWRLQEPIGRYLKEKGYLGNYDRLSITGAIKSLVKPDTLSDRQYLLDQISKSKKLHNIREIVLMNHTDCGDYGGSRSFSNPLKEEEVHLNDMRVAKKILADIYKDIDIKIVLVRVGDNKVTFECIE